MFGAIHDELRQRGFTHGDCLVRAAASFVNGFLVGGLKTVVLCVGAKDCRQHQKYPYSFLHKWCVVVEQSMYRFNCFRAYRMNSLLGSARPLVVLRTMFHPFCGLAIFM